MVRSMGRCATTRRSKTASPARHSPRISRMAPFRSGSSTAPVTTTCIGAGTSYAGCSMPRTTPRRRSRSPDRRVDDCVDIIFEVSVGKAVAVAGDNIYTRHHTVIEGAMAAADGGAAPNLAMRRWPAAGPSRVPNWVYTDPDIFAREQERIFQGPSWLYVCLETEIPNAGDF